MVYAQRLKIIWIILFINLLYNTHKPTSALVIEFKRIELLQTIENSNKFKLYTKMYANAILKVF